MKGTIAPEGLLRRRDGDRVRWSTDPLDLLDGAADELNEQALWRCCRGGDVFVCRHMQPVRPGELVVMTPGAGTGRSGRTSVA